MDAHPANSGTHIATSAQGPRRLSGKELVRPEVIADPERVVAGVILVDHDDVLGAALVHGLEMEPVSPAADAQARARRVADLPAVHVDGGEGHGVDAQATRPDGGGHRKWPTLASRGGRR